VSYTYGSNIGYKSSGSTYGGEGQFNPRNSISSEFIRRIQLPNITKVFLLTVTTRQWLTNVETVSGNWVRFKVAGPVTGVFENNGEESLRLAAFKEDSANSGSYWYEASEGKVYLTPTDNGYAYGRTFQAGVSFYFCSGKAKKFNDIFWEPRLLTIPNISLRVDDRWSTRGSPSQIGGGKVTLANADGYFDAKDAEGIYWDAGQAQIRMGIDLPEQGAAGEMNDYSNYQLIGTWRVEGTERTDDSFSLNLRELKTKLENLIPHMVFTRAEYPAIANDVVGKPIPLAWGRIKGAKPILIDGLLKKFKVAGHPIRSFDGIRIKIDDAWTDSGFVSTDLANAEFTLGDDWTGTEEVSVDFSGRKLPDGSLMSNCADVIGDVLDYVGETNFDDTSFTESRRLLKIGTNRYGHEVNASEPAIHLTEQRTAKDVVAQINEIASSSLFVDFTGNWRYVVFNTVRGTTLNNVEGSLPHTFTEQDIIVDSFRRQVDTSKVVSKVLVKFAERKAEGYSERVELEREQNRLLHNLPHQFTEERSIALSEPNHARAWGLRFLVTEAESLVKYYFTVPWNGFFILPTDKIHVTYARNGFDAILEVLEVSYDLIKGQLKLVCGNQRGFGDSFWFWSEDGADDWDNGWTDAEVKLANQNQGFWTVNAGGIAGETDMVTDADSRSWRPGRWF
jgi:hypothetical protein